jgi:hypothetical protein
MMKVDMPIVFLILVLSGCSQDQAGGVYVEIFLQNDKNINSYVVFNRDVKTIEECEASFAKSLPIIMENPPPPIPMNSKATGWKCSLTDPAKAK